MTIKKLVDYSTDEYIEFDKTTEAPLTPEEKIALWEKAYQEGTVKKLVKDNQSKFDIKEFLKQSLATTKEAIPAATSELKNTFTNTAKIVKGDPEAVSEASSNLIKPIPQLEKAKEIISKQGLVGNIASNVVPTSQLEIGMYGISPKIPAPKIITAIARPIEKGIAKVGGKILSKIFPPKVPQEVFMKKQNQLLNKARLGSIAALELVLNKGAELHQLVEDYIGGKPLDKTIKELKKLAMPTPREELPTGFARRKSAQTIKDSTLPYDVKEKVLTNPAINYKQRPVAMVEKMADDIMSLGDDKAIEAFKSESSDVTNILAEKLANKLGSEGKIEAAEKITLEAMKRGTSAGQVVNTFKYWKKLSPASILRRVQERLIEIETRNPDQITNAMKHAWMKKGQEIGVMKAGEAQDLATYNLFDSINKAIPDKESKQLMSLYKAMLLTLPKSHFINITSNVMQAIGMNTSKVVATPIDMAASVLTGKRTTTLPQVPSWIKGFKEGGDKARGYLMTGFDPRNIANKFDISKTYYNNTRVGKLLQKGTEAIFRALGGADMPFWYATYNSALREQAIVAAKNAGAKNVSYAAKRFMVSPTETMQKRAFQEALESTFQNETRLNKIMQEIAKIPGGQILLPFKRTPAAFITEVFNYTPVGAAKTLYQSLISKTAGQYEIVKGLSKSLTGSSVLGLGYYMAKQGYLTGSYPKTSSPKGKSLDELEGKQYASIKIGDTYKSLRSLGIAGELLNIGADIYHAKKEGGSANMVTAGLAGTGTSMYNQQFLTNMSNVIKAFQDTDKSAPKLAANVLGSFVPTAVGGIARGDDEFKRETKALGLKNQLTNALKSKIPELRKTLPPKTDVFGEKVKDEATAVGAFFDVFGTNLARNTNDPVVKEFKKLKERGFDPVPVKIELKESIAGVKVNIPPNDLAVMQAYIGKRYHNTIKQFIETDLYKILPNDRKAAEIENVYSDFKKVGLFKYAEQQGVLGRGVKLDEIRHMTDKQLALYFADKYVVTPSLKAILEQKKRNYIRSLK
jgi:hypothetical protein